MFTGLIEEIGQITDVSPQPGGEARIVIHGPRASSDAGLGDSIAVDGVCLTVVDLPRDGTFVVEAVPETLQRTTLGRAVAGTSVNLERALMATSRLGGHIVQGHVDGVGTLLHRRDGGRWVDMTFSLPSELAPLVAEKGSITISGISLTVTGVTADTFGVSLIPTTLAETTLGGLAEGMPVNLEVDIIARYVARLLEGQKQ